MARVTGIGGVFFKAEDPEKLYAWYEKHLGITRKHGFVSLPAQDFTLWSLFKKQSDYFAPSVSQLMINYRVEDLDGLLEALREEGVPIDPKSDDGEYGRFAWIMDPEGNKIELWEPPKTPDA